MTHTLSHIIKIPRITEKGAISAEHNAYVFNVMPAATKYQIAKAVEEIYKVKPVKVNVVNIPSKKTFTKGKRGTKGGGRKAYVYLKKGDQIQVA
jgi:large subunit ribosomal protein L23